MMRLIPPGRSGLWLVILLALLPVSDLRLSRPVHAIVSAVFPAQLDGNSTYLPLIPGRQAGGLLIAAAHIDSALSGEADEAILLWNTGYAPVALAGWQLRANGRTAVFPPEMAQILAPGGWLWCAAQARAFRLTFGELPGCEWNAADPLLDEPAVPNLSGGALRLTNTGGVVQLLDPAGQVVDTLLYGNATAPATGWQGPPAQLYTRGAVSASGQLYFRKPARAGGLPLDGDTAQDWAGDLADLTWGRQARLPGWPGYPTDAFSRPAHGTASATVTLAVGPEGLYAPIAQALAGATTTIDLSLYTFEHPDLAQVLARAAGDGVRVRLLLEGAPPGGVTDLQRWCVRLVAAAGAEVRYLAATDHAPNGLQPRYRYTHAKIGVVDGRLALVGTENFSLDSMPVETAAPVGGRRGFYLITDAAPVVEAVARLFALDWAPDRFMDLQPYTPDHARYGDPPPSYSPPAAPTIPVAAAPFTLPLTVQGQARFTVVSAPENAMHPHDGLHRLLQQAGPGDAIHLVQLYEHPFWGDGDSNPVADPNPRLELILAAARRGASVRVLLDSHFDDPAAPRSNQATVDYLQAAAAAEGLDLEARRGNPTGGGIHAKVVLIRLDGELWSALGSLNGGEISHKLNREVMVLTDQPAIYERLAEVFQWDWARSP
ncbi:MAG TPA: phospholipase D-like domain-containing protein [Caldilineaceae bacterium]|nr:phospholipase D-like domain-containing protein [Caldilineaceae bacterium]